MYEIAAKYLIFATGQLDTAFIPDFPGLEKYRGKIMHIANWDGNENLRDRRVAVIGNGASGVQIIPEIASSAQSLTVFQRSPSWIIPRNNSPLSRLE